MLSVAIITLNEEENLGRTLESVKDLAHEIVILDSFSSDRTCEIARTFGARVEQRKFDGFSSQKNHLLDLCTKDWVLLIDADEELSADLRLEIRAQLKNPEADVYEFPFQSFCFGSAVHYGGWSGFKKIRLFKKGMVRFGTERVHERFIVAQNAHTASLRNPLYHHTYLSVEECLQKMNRYSSSAAIEMFENKKRANLFSLVLSPAIGFFKGYFLKLGFLDGFLGLILAINNAHYHFSKYVKLMIMVQKGEKSGSSGQGDEFKSPPGR